MTEHVHAPATSPPGFGVGSAVAPSCYLVHRNRPDLAYKGLVDPVNERLAIKYLRFEDGGAFTADILRTARMHEVGKVYVYASENQWRHLIACGFVLEAIWDGLFRGDPGYVLGYPLSDSRRGWGNLEHQLSVVESALAAGTEPPPALSAEYRLVTGDIHMATDLAAVYDQTFTSFPSPMHEPGFVSRLIASGEGVFLAVMHGERIASAAALEIDREFAVAEATNCATLPEYRGEGLMQILLAALEGEAARQQLPTLYSIARAGSFGMNLALSKAGYSYRGCLRSSSHIMGGFEDMNLWVKLLGVPATFAH